MPNFSELFIASHGQPILYKGRELRLVDVLAVEAGQRLTIVFEGATSEWRQAILLNSTAAIRVGGKTTDRTVVLWQDTAARRVDLVIERGGKLSIQNGWDYGDGAVDSGRGGAAMIVDETPVRRRYRCNDAYPDEDFDDLVFRIERLRLGTLP